MEVPRTWRAFAICEYCKRESCVEVIVKSDEFDARTFVFCGFCDQVPLLTQPVQGFATKQVARDNLDLQIEGVRDSIPVLQAELEQARHHAAQTDYEVELARERVFVSEAQVLADDFAQRLLEVRLMAMRLKFMSLKQVRRDPNANTIAGTGTQFYGQGQSRSISMPREVMDAIGEEITGSFDRRNPPRVKDDIGRAIQDYWAALRMDADAMLDTDELASICRPSPIYSPHRALAPGDDTL